MHARLAALVVCALGVLPGCRGAAGAIREPDGGPGACVRGTIWDGTPCEVRRGAARDPHAAEEPRSRLATSFRTPAVLVRLRDPVRLERLRDAAAIAADLRDGEPELASLPADDPSRRMALWRLASQYAELERAWLFAKDDARAAQARKGAIRHIEALLEGHRAATSDLLPLADEATYHLAWEYERNDDYTHARQLYAGLVAQCPESTRVPFATFALGEMYWNESLAFGAYLQDARRAYEEVAAERSATNTLAPFALLRVGQIHERLADRARAKLAYDRLATEFPGSDAAREISEWAQR